MKVKDKTQVIIVVLKSKNGTAIYRFGLPLQKFINQLLLWNTGLKKTPWVK